MFTSSSGKDCEIKKELSVIDPDLDIGKLGFSSIYKLSCMRADESSVAMVPPNVPMTDAIFPAPEMKNEIANNTIITDAVGCIWKADLPGQSTEEGNDSIRYKSSDFIRTANSSRDEDGDEAEVVDDIDTLQTPNHPVIVYQSSRRKSVRSTNNKLNQQNVSRNCRKIAQKNLVLDLNSLKLTRRKRSLFPMRARSSVWGLLGTTKPDFEDGGNDPNVDSENKPGRVRDAQGKKSTTMTKTDRKSVQKISHPTGHFTLKIKIGNQSCGMIHVAKDLNASEKITHGLLDIKESKFRGRLAGDVLLPRERNSEKVLSSDVSVLTPHLENVPFSTSNDLHQIDVHEKGNILRASTENRCSDPGTSPDSEVINSAPNATHFDKGLQNMQDTPIVTTERGNSKCFTNSVPDISVLNISSLSSSENKCKKGKKKDRHHELGNCSVENQLTGAKTTSAKTELVSSIQSLNSQAGETLIPCGNGKKYSKCSKSKGQSNNMFEIVDITSKKEKASKTTPDNKKLESKHQIAKKGDASGDLDGVKSHLVAGNQIFSDVEETGYLSKGTSGPINISQVPSGELKDQCAPTRSAWVLCDECQKWRRIPATLADQIEETNSGWTCKDNSDIDFSDCSIPQEKSNSEINEELEISDGEEDAYNTLPTSNKNRSQAVPQSSSWSLIKSNLFLHRSRKTQTIDEVMVCHCKPPSDGRMGCRAKCLNRMLNIECVRGTCPCGELCSNQQFQKRKYAKLKWFRCGKKGFGLQALDDIFQGQFLIEYVGEVLDIHAYEARQKEYASQGHKHFYFMTLNGSEVIDACAKGNLGRFINHSCDPNCRTEKWMVNGEVCVGLFAVRDIKKDEEITFDYNYVRVFGASAKKCVCGSPNCRGYIGGDPTNSEGIVQGESDEEFAEPVMTCDDREMKNDWKDIISNSAHDRENVAANKPPESKDRKKKPIAVTAKTEIITSETSTQEVSVSSANMSSARHMVQDNAVVGQLDGNKRHGEVSGISAPAVSEVKIEGIQSQGNLDSPVSLQSEDIMKKSLSPAQQPPNSDVIIPALPSKSQSNTIESKRKLKYAMPDSSVKTRSPSSMKKGKPKSTSVRGKGTPDVDKSNEANNKSKNSTDVSLNSHVESVEKKLNELLDTEGGISKRKDASRGYLKLLFLTAASGTNGHGEAIQSTRDLSMILDVLLKTKSRAVLVDIISKNGLQMLHNIMKRYRKQFNKTPILRKLLKVLEYLATREILTLEHITGGPPCQGVESFRDSILTLTEHGDRQVHQIARNFRDRWIPRHLRRKCFMETDDDDNRKLESLHNSTYGRSSISSHDLPNDQVEKTAEPIVISGTLDPSSAPNSNNRTTETRIRKRKSRWDNPSEENPTSRIKTDSSNDIDTPPGFSHPFKDDSTPPGFSSPRNYETAPPGFSSPCKKPTVRPFGTVIGYSQVRFAASMPVSYGVPYSVMQQFGMVKAENSENRKVVPGLPFHQFPPLPPYKKGGPPPPITESRPSSESAANLEQGNFSGQKRTIAQSSDSDASEINISAGPEFPRVGGSCSLGRKFFRQQKWNNAEQVPAPRVQKSNDWAHGGSTRSGAHPGLGSENGANQFRNSYN